jgi:hypothetical protein
MSNIGAWTCFNAAQAGSERLLRDTTVWITGPNAAAPVLASK